MYQDVTERQCCGTETVYSGSGSYFGKVSIPVPHTDPDPDHTYLEVFQIQFFKTKSRLFNVRSSIVTKKVVISFLIF